MKLLHFITLGCLLVSAYFLWQKYNPTPLISYPEDVIKQNPNHDLLPKMLLIPDVGIHVPVIPQKMEKTTWPQTTKGVSYLRNSPIPGSIGNSILYGHNWTNILGKLSQVRPGMKIYIEQWNGTYMPFTTIYTLTVNSHETSILKSSTDKRITLYTCTGFLDSKRFVVVAIADEKLTSFVSR